MTTQVQFRRGTTAQHSSFTGAVGEITVDTDKKAVVVHDGSTAGGLQVPTLAGAETLSNKTLASPAFSGTIADLGAVTTMDLNGGTIDGVTIGGSTPGAGTFTSLTSNSIVDASGAIVTVNNVLRANDSVGTSARLDVYGWNSNFGPMLRADGASNSGLNLDTNGTGGHVFTTNSGNATQVKITHVASAVNWVQMSGGATGGSANILARGEANTDIRIGGNGTGVLDIFGTAATAASTPSNFSAAQYLAIKVNGTTKYLPLATATW
ncbi:MAG: hypothetical protein VX464_11675 [Pseudomonadota bacterium]|nr:hypothetical protein [Pseudomonadota bacterium]